MILQRNLRRAAWAAIVVGLVWGCDERSGTGPTGGDQTPPTVTIQRDSGTVDINEGLQFTVTAADNISLRTVTVTVTGAVTLSFDTTFTTTTPSFTSVFEVSVGSGSSGGQIILEANATDGNDNEATAAFDTVTVFDGQPPTQTLISPVAGDVFGNDSTIRAIARVTDPSGVSSIVAELFTTDNIGFVTVHAADTSVLATAAIAVTDTLNVVVPAVLAPGTYQLRTSAADQAGNSGNGTPINVTVADLNRPMGSFISPALDSVVIAGDSVLVSFRAQDQTGVDSVRFIGRALRGDSSLGTNEFVDRFLPKTAILAGAQDTTFRRFLLPVITDSTMEQVILEATIFDVSASGNPVSVTSTIQIVDGPFTNITAPLDSTNHPVGVPIAVDVTAFSPNRIGTIFVQASGVITGADTSVLANPGQTRSRTLSIPVPATANLGEVLLEPFALDTMGGLIPGEPVTVFLTDEQAPTITINLPGTGFLVRRGDSVRIEAQVQDNRGVTAVDVDGVAHRGVPSLGTDTVVQRFDLKTATLDQATDTLFLRDLLPTDGEDTAEQVFLRVTVQDSSGNTARDSVQIEVVAGPALDILAPADSSVVAPGKSLTILVRGQADPGIKKLGFTTQGVLAITDTTKTLPTANPQVQDTTLSFVLNVPASTPFGFFSISPFGRDSLGNVGTGNDIAVEVVASAGASDNTPPLVTDSLDLRTETDDSIAVRATDVGGITKVGFRVSTLAGAQLSADSSLTPAGTSTDVNVTFELGLDTVSTFPLEAVVTVFAEDSVGNRGELSRTGSPVGTGAGAADTVTLVAGKTVPLPQGGIVADAIFDSTTSGTFTDGRLFLTNIELDQVEVFDIGTTSFTSSIAVGSRPWGIALWPRRLDNGEHGDTIVVANSGGTNMSIVDITPGAEREVRRHALPNFVIHRVRTDPDGASNGTQLKLIIEEHDFSDRPEYLGMICRPGAAAPACAPDSIYAVYSTTPTIDQGDVFELRGSLRWENLTACGPGANDVPVPTGETCQSGPGVPQSHFIYEHATRNPGEGVDTLQIILQRGRAPFEVRVDAASVVTVEFDKLGFRDTTFVRNSGNFERALIGEGGDVGEDLFARAIAYNSSLPIDSARDTLDILSDSLFGLPTFTDRGVSPGIEVRDFISNTAIPVRSIGINFNGLTNLVRADSIYVLNQFLRLTGLIEADNANPGMDLNFNHSFDASAGGTPGTDGGGLDPDNRLLFAAREDPNIGVYDTWFFELVTTVPIKDPVIGPLRVAVLNTGEQLLIGVTKRGVVTVRLPAITNIFPSAGGANVGWPPR